MRRLLALLFAAVLTVFPSCGKAVVDETQTAADATASYVRTAYIFDPANEGASDRDASAAIEDYCATAGIEFKKYFAKDETEKDRIAAVDEAVKDGANLVVMSGYYMQDVVFAVQDLYKDTYFLLLDATYPSGYLGESFSGNTHAEILSLEDLCYVAGYIAVTDGAESPGFAALGDSYDAARCFSGFASGVSDAARGLGIDTVTLTCKIGGGLSSRTLEAFDAGCDVVAALGPEAKNAVEAAEEYGARVIPVSADIAGVCVMSYPVFNYGVPAAAALDRFVSNGGEWSVRDSGEYSVSGLAEGAVGAVFVTGGGASFGTEMLDELTERARRGEITVAAEQSVYDVSVSGVTINY